MLKMLTECILAIGFLVLPVIFLITCLFRPQLEDVIDLVIIGLVVAAVFLGHNFKWPLGIGYCCLIFHEGVRWLTWDKTEQNAFRRKKTLMKGIIVSAHAFALALRMEIIYSQI